MSVGTIESLRRAILEYDAEAACSLAKRVAAEKLDPITVMNELTATINQVGELFGKGELWLPDLVGAADAMQVAMPILEEEIKKVGKKRESLGIVVVGTVFGDIHDIGKSMVSTLLLAEGFEVHDLGVNIKAEEFIKAIDKYQPDILAMSALLTMTAPEQRKVINTLKERGIREKVKVMVGGGAITGDFAQSIGADGYDPTAPGAVKLAKRLIGV